MAELDGKTPAPRPHEQYVREDKHKSKAAFDNARREYVPPGRQAKSAKPDKTNAPRLTYEMGGRIGTAVRRDAASSQLERERRAARFEASAAKEAKSDKNNDAPERER